MALSLDGTTGISASGNIYGNNIIVTNTLSAGSFSPAVVVATGNITGGNVLTGGLISATGNITSAANISGSYLLGNAYYVTGLSPTQIYNGTSNVTVVDSGANITVGVGGTSNVVVWATTGEYVTGLISASGNVTGGNVNTAGLISATGNITGGNLSGTSIVGTLTTAAQTNITSVGTLGSLTVTANVTGGNVLTGGLISATGNITGGNIDAGTGTITVGGLSFNGNTIVSTGATLTIDPNSSGGVDGAVVIAGNLSVTGNVTYFNSNVVTINDKFINLANNAATAAAADGSGIGVGPLAAEYASLTYNSTGNIWIISNGANVSGVLNASGNVTGGNITTAGLISATGNITGGNILGGANVNATTHTGTTVSVSGNVTGGNILTGGLISATGAITGGAITGSSLTVSTGNIAGGNINNNNTTGVGNIGSSTVTFNTVFAKATSAQYADLAERYVADADYTPGTVLDFGGDHEVTISNVPGSPRIAGVVSTNPAHVMNADQLGKHTVVIALTGRVPTSVVGTVRKGDMMVSAGNGVAQASSTPAMGTVIGKALEDFDNQSGVIEIVVGRL